MLLFMLLEKLLIPVPFMALFGPQAWVRYGDLLVSAIGLLALGTYLTLAFRRFYQAGAIWSLLAAALSSLTLAVIVVAYRMVLFYKIIYTGH